MKTEKRFLHCAQQRLVRQRGASLLEGIAYLGIAAIVVLGAVSLLTNAFGSAKANQMVEEITALRTAVRKLYVGQAYPANAVPDLIATNAAPSTLARGANSTLVNGWGGTVTVGAVAGGFTITYPSVPQDVCINVVNGASGWTQISDGTTNIAAFPATVAAATSVCAATANNLTFTSN
jgi:hypothetical protein